MSGDPKDDTIPWRDQAFPTPATLHHVRVPGMSKREYFALHIFCNTNTNIYDAVKQADQLLKALAHGS